MDRPMNRAVGRVVQAGASYRGKQLPDYTPGISAETVAEAGG